MISTLLVAMPFAFAVAIVAFGRSKATARALTVACAVSHTAAYLAAAVVPELGSGAGGGMLTPTLDDPIRHAVLGMTSLLFLCVSIQLCKWLPAAYTHESGHGTEVMPENIFLGCMTAFLGSMSLVVLSSNFGLLWVAIEATTLFSAPLIIFHRNAESIEAMWKYMLICSVGIGFALFGTMLMAHSSQVASGHEVGLDAQSLALVRETFSPTWFKAAFIFIIAGYGTKMGLAPFHTWLPDAHSEAPATVSALLSGSLLNCSFLAITRFRAIAPSSVAPFCDNLMIAAGIVSIATAAIFIIGQRDFKRMLAYSSVEHMGLILVLFALGSKLLPMHIVFHSLVKMSLFLLAGNILLAYGTRNIGSVRGMFSSMPRTAVMWTAGILLICGTPPSPLFITEFALVLDGGPVIGGIVLLLLFIVFGGMVKTAITMAMGNEADSAAKPRETPRGLLAVPIAVLAATAAYGLAAYFIIPLGK